MKIPKEVVEKFDLELGSNLPIKKEIKIDNSLPTLIYNYYNMDPNWRKNEKVNRVLLLEPKVFSEYPISKKCLDFCLNLSKNDIQKNDMDHNSGPEHGASKKDSYTSVRNLSTVFECLY